MKGIIGRLMIAMTFRERRFSGARSCP